MTCALFFLSVWETAAGHLHQSVSIIHEQLINVYNFSFNASLETQETLMIY